MVSTSDPEHERAEIATAAQSSPKCVIIKCAPRGATPFPSIDGGPAGRTARTSRGELVSARRAVLSLSVATLLLSLAAVAAVAGDVPYVPTPHEVVQHMLKLAELKSGDLVYDLGCGDGRIVIEAARTPGVRGVCVEIDPERIAEARENAKQAGVSDRIRFVQGDLFEVPFSDATVVTLYLLPQVNLRLRPRLLKELRPGTRVVSHAFDMGDWTPERKEVVELPVGHYTLFRWTIREAHAATP